MEYVYSVASVTDILYVLRIHHNDYRFPHIFATMEDVEEFTKSNPLPMFRYYEIQKHEVKSFKRCVKCKTNLVKDTEPYINYGLHATRPSV